MAGVGAGPLPGPRVRGAPWPVDLMVMRELRRCVVNVLMTIRRRTDRSSTCPSGTPPQRCPDRLHLRARQRRSGSRTPGRCRDPGRDPALGFSSKPSWLLLSPWRSRSPTSCCRSPRAARFTATRSAARVWSLIIVYTTWAPTTAAGAGADLAKTIAIVGQRAMSSGHGLLINIWYTVPAVWGDIHATSAPSCLPGTIYYFFVNIQGSMMALPTTCSASRTSKLGGGAPHIGVLASPGSRRWAGVYLRPAAGDGRPLYSASWRTCSTGWS